MKHKLLGILVASICIVPVLAMAHDPTASPTSTSTSTANGGAGGSGGNAAGGMATGGNATNTISGTTANGNTSTVNLSVSLPASSGSSGSSGTTGTTAAAGTTAGAAGDPGSSPYNTKTTVDYNGSYSVKNAPPVSAPSLTTTLSDTCMGSVSFGLSLTGFGATGASTMVDQACVRRLDSREFRAMGMNDVALALLCQSEANRKAVEAAGHECPGMTKPVATNTTVQQSAGNTNSAVSVSSVSSPDTNEIRDPYVRRRLGLEALPDTALK